ncbi:MAG: hypothetical protein JXQ96_00720 [Cyclobacteriaceae bacterium]
MEAESEVQIKAPKKKKVKKGTFYGVRTKKGFVRTGFGDRSTLELFYYLREFEEPDQYVRDIYWYNFKKRKLAVSSAGRIDKENAGILHGPYKKMLGDQLLEEGVFYKGTKHARWSYWNKNDIRTGKEKYYKGWPKESKVQYYNKATKQIKEIIPVHFGEKEGNYYAFYPSGNVAVRGEYKFDGKVGIWTEYHDLRNRKKRQIQYGKDPFDESFRPYIMREWDKRGRQIYESAKK